MGGQRGRARAVRFHDPDVEKEIVKHPVASEGDPRSVTGPRRIVDLSAPRSDIDGSTAISVSPHLADAGAAVAVTRECEPLSIRRPGRFIEWCIAQRGALDNVPTVGVHYEDPGRCSAGSQEGDSFTVRRPDRVPVFGTGGDRDEASPVGVREIDPPVAHERNLSGAGRRGTGRACDGGTRVDPFLEAGPEQSPT